MGAPSSFRNYRSDRLSSNDLDEIRNLLADFFDEFSAEVASQVEAIKSEKPAEYLTTRQVAKMTGFSQATLEAFRSKRQGPAYYKQGANVRYRLEDIRAWMESERFE
ncbi:helix-turn-helix domain-containing protein [Tropicimonas sp. TH_r6]|uniref:helix-turn-helix transcriptional regulator n=1 Tax=Tropicimonas sp. TH_r6 TaxID=3082085 RepID=UPI002955A15F|nr:helix-turn-helix domain-containing protein [Tropicimonas sp. TH_r6]MDV7143420.1 helix-turn-helix domain-containing protein [Tropicimonas sp. TH_r6]